MSNERRKRARKMLSDHTLDAIENPHVRSHAVDAMLIFAAEEVAKERAEKVARAESQL